MSEDKNTSPPATPPAPQQDEDVLFKLQVAATEFFLRNGKYAIFAAVAALLVAGGYGTYHSWKESRDEDQFAAVADIDHRMPKIDQMAIYGLAPRDDRADTARMANLEEGARRYEAVAAKNSGTAAVFAWMHAADAWDRAGRADTRLSALQQASSIGAPGLAGFAADAAYAGALLDAGRVEEAQKLYRDMSGKYEHIYGAQSLASLARTQLDANKVEDAKATLAELKTRFPTQATLAAELELRLAAPSGA